MPTKLPSTEEVIELAIKEVHEAMLENFLAGQAEMQAKDRKHKAHHALQKANERLRAIQTDMYEIVLEVN